MDFEDDQGRTFKLDVLKQKDRTMIYGNGWKQYISQNNFIRGDDISFFLERVVNMLRTLYFFNNHDGVDEDDDDDQDHDNSQDD